MLNVCIIGITGYGSYHFADLFMNHHQGLISLKAATIVNPHELPEDALPNLENMGCKVYADYREMIAACSGICDLCVIPTGIHWHAPMAIAALDAGLNVLLEKPAAAIISDIHAMQAAERRSGKRVMIGFQSMYADETLSLKRLILNETLGKITEAVSWSLSPRNAAYYNRNGWAGRRIVNNQPVFDSPINNAVAHYLHMMLFLTGSDEVHSSSVTAIRAELYRAKPIDSFDTAAVAITTTSEIPCRFLTTHATDVNVSPTIEIRGERATVHWVPGVTLCINYRNGRSDTLPQDNRRVCRQRMYAAIREALAGGNPFLARLEHALEHTRVVNLAHAACPIRTIGPEHQSGEGIIAGMSELMTATVATPGSLFSDHRAPWATPALHRAASPDPTIAEMMGT